MIEMSSTFGVGEFWGFGAYCLVFGGVLVGAAGFSGMGLWVTVPKI